MSSSRSGLMDTARGFTLLEVLVALVIVGIVLGACIRGVGVLLNSGSYVEQRLMATWSADNRIKHIQIEKLWPEVGSYEFGCMQGRYQFHCKEVVTATLHDDVRSVEVEVFSEQDQALVAQARYMAVKYAQ